MTLDTFSSNRYRRQLESRERGSRHFPNSVMSELLLAQRQLQKARSRYQAAFIHTKAYRGVPYEHVTNAKPVPHRLTYRGVSYSG